MAKATKTAPKANSEEPNKVKPKAETKPAAAKTEKVAREPQEKKNGIARPRAGGTSARIWDISDSLSKLNLKNPQVAKRSDVLAAAENENINGATAATQYGRWRRFNGITGRVDGEAAE